MAKNASRILNEGGKEDCTRSEEVCGLQTPLTLVVSNDEWGKGGMRGRREGKWDLPPCGLWRVLRDAFQHCSGGENVDKEDVKKEDVHNEENVNNEVINDAISCSMNHLSPQTWCLLVYHLSALLASEILGTLRWQDLNGGEGDTQHRGLHWLGLWAMIQYLLT